MREGGEDDDKGMVSDVEGVQSLGGRETLSSMRDGICVCVAAVVVVVVALMVAVGVLVLVIVVGVVVLVIMVRVLGGLCIGVVAVVVVLCVGVGEMGCIGVVHIMVLAGDFLMEVVERVELVVGCVVKLVCEWERIFFVLL